VVGAAVAGAADATAAPHRARGNVNEDLVVTLVTPTTNQEVLPDLSDPGLNNVVTVRFSAPLKPSDFISNNNVYNRLTSAVEFMNSSFDRLPGTPIVTGNVFRFDPRTPGNGGVLPNGQYTVNIKKSVRSGAGKLLNQGTKDFTSTFSVGTDVYAPVLRTISPINNQTGIGLFQKIVATFNEPILGSSLLTTITVQDTGTNPPTAILGAGGGTGVTTDRNGFDVVFTPDPCFGYPPKATIEFRMQGRPIAHNPPPLPSCPTVSTVTAVSDVFGNQFSRDAGLQWTLDPTQQWVYNSPNGTFEDCTGVFKMQFQTRGTTPLPIGMYPGSSQWRTQSPCGSFNTVWANSCDFQGRVFFYTTATGLGEIDITNIIVYFSLAQIQDYTRARIVPNSPVRMGRPLGMMVDPRYDVFSAASFNHTFIYVVDERSKSVLIVDSRNLKTIGRFTGFSSPRDVGMSTDYGAGNLGGPGRVTMWVTDFAAREVVALEMSSIAVSLGGQPGAQTPCDAIKDNFKLRTHLPTGDGPADVAGDSFLLKRAMVVNSLDSSVTLIDASRMKIIKNHQVGGNPLSCDWTFFRFGFIDLCAITNQGGLTDPNGSVSLYLKAPPLQNFYQAAAQNRDGVDATITDGIKNPTYVWGNQEWASGAGNSVPQAFFVPNTGAKTILDMRLQISGIFGLLIDLQTNQVREVGFNPTSAVMDAFYPNQFLFACVSGEAKFVGMDPLRNVAPQGITVPGIRRIFTCYSH
jgi:hypothetical protein